MIALRLLGFLWALPVTLVGLVVVLFFGPSSPRVRWLGYHGVRLILELRLARLPEGFGAITFGHVQGYRQAPDIHRRHEDVHTLQGDLLGALNLPIYGACSLVSKLRGTGWYYGCWLEVWARRWAARS